ncbi:hypothetical protein [Streptomyces sp. HC307]|uniref:hypothetical protein n=1 Tax=Streptomyces flavusporus TaxID=3385496 RepID=UPI003916E904
MNTTSTPAASALAEPPLPSLNGLSEQQIRGTTCVWDGIALTPETAVDLGPRKTRRLDGECQWFPRACRTCVGQQAMRVLFDHTEGCEQCRRTEKDSACDTGRALLRLSIRKGR